MAIQTPVGGNGTGQLFVGEDKLFRLKNVTDYTGALVDMTGWTVVFDVRKTPTSSSALILITATLIGVFNSDPAVNTQMQTAQVTDDLLNLFKGLQEYWYSWKRTDEGFETVLAYGSFTPEKATAQ